MAQFTQRAIIQTFRDMLEQTPFDKITVSGIVSKCGISSNTFYYHFRDIYDLLEAWLQEEKEQVIRSSAPRDSWQDMMKTILHAVQENRTIVHHILNSLSRERLEQYIFDSTDDSVYQIVCREAAGRQIPEERLRDIADFCRYAFLGFFLKYIWNNMNSDVDETVDRLSVLFQGFLCQAIEDCSHER